MFEKLSGDYNRGYTKAIQDIMQVFDYVESDLNYHHIRMNQRLAEALLHEILQSRECIREGRNGFIRWNSQKKSFEWFETEVKDERFNRLRGVTRSV